MDLPETGGTICKTLRRVVQILLEENGWQSINCLLCKDLCYVYIQFVSLNGILQYLVTSDFYSLNLKLYK